MYLRQLITQITSVTCDCDYHSACVGVACSQSLKRGVPLKSFSYVNTWFTITLQYYYFYGHRSCLFINYPKCINNENIVFFAKRLMYQKLFKRMNVKTKCVQSYFIDVTWETSNKYVIYLWLVITMKYCTGTRHALNAINFKIVLPRSTVKPRLCSNKETLHLLPPPSYSWSFLSITATIDSSKTSR